MDKPVDVSAPPPQEDSPIAVPRNLRVELQYDGTDFHGWQIQPNLSTIQGTLSKAVQDVVKETVSIHGSGRTDAGAHALAQVCNFHTFTRISVTQLLKALNSRLPPSIRVTAVQEAHPNFHARHDARLKHYRYRILNARWCSPFEFRFVHHCYHRLHFEAMSRAAELALGEHDFSAFCDSDSSVEKKVRRLTSSFFVFDTQRDLLEYNVCANGFLHHMVRNLVGTFLEMGKGRMAVEDFARILESKKRSNAGPTAPAKGLFLVSVSY